MSLSIEEKFFKSIISLELARESADFGDASREF